jgi:hypothetical protein
MLAGEEKQQTLLQAGALGGVVPFVFALFLAGNHTSTFSGWCSSSG